MVTSLNRLLPLAILQASLVVPCLLLGATKAPPLVPQTPEQILRLEIKGPTERTIEAGEQIYLAATLVNRSRNQSILVMKSGDGSDCGWRSAYIFLSATLDQENGQPPEELKRDQYARCAHMNPLESSDFVELKPGERLDLTARVTPIPITAQEPGIVSARFHYRHIAFETRCVVWAERSEFPNWIPQEMLGIPNYEVVSPSIRFRITRPLDVTAKIVRPMKIGEVANLSDLIDLKVKNCTTSPFLLKPIVQSDIPAVRLECDYESQLRFNGNFVQVIVPKKNENDFTLEAGQSTSILGQGPFSNGLDYNLGPFPSAGTVRFRAILMSPGDPSTGPQYRRQIATNWIELPVEK